MPIVDSLSDHSDFIVGKLEDLGLILLMSKHEIDPGKAHANLCTQTQ
ncbi:MAG: hypothetical protein ABI604_05075 [Nitrospirota bacterium]